MTCEQYWQTAIETGKVLLVVIYVVAAFTIGLAVGRRK